jgi:hypothetical protein
MERPHLPLIAAAALLALGSGCVTPDANRSAPKKPDVTQPGVLPPPQETMKPATAVAPTEGVVPAGGIPASAPAAAPRSAAPAIVPTSAATMAKLKGWTEKKVPAAEMAVAWKPRIAFLPDPSRNGALGCGLVGQMYLFGPNMEFVQADGTLTVDLVDDTPRPAGQPAATPERWQLDKTTLRSLRITDETFGKSYVLFLPWPAYKPDITRVRISARYDPDNTGFTVYQKPTSVTIDTSGPLGTPVWDGVSTTSASPVGARSQPLTAGMPAFGTMVPAPQPQPFPTAPAYGTPVPAPRPQPFPQPQPVPLSAAPAPNVTPAGMTLDGLPPIAITVGR